MYEVFSALAKGGGPNSLRKDANRYSPGKVAYNLINGYDAMSSSTAYSFWKNGNRNALQTYLEHRLSVSQQDALSKLLEPYWFSNPSLSPIQKYIELLEDRAFRQLAQKERLIPFAKVEMMSAGYDDYEQSLKKRFGKELLDETGPAHICPSCKKNVLRDSGPIEGQYMVGILDME